MMQRTQISIPILKTRDSEMPCHAFRLSRPLRVPRPGGSTWCILLVSRESDQPVPGFADTRPKRDRDADRA